LSDKQEIDRTVRAQLRHLKESLDT
jgi:hypothetical protein